ncbi:MAG TPA: MarR family transcriptional regulator [Gemmatimonadales bacterium]|nr:MarR family transcriptional regulator [Gemmatimonadales bacterium]
MDPRTTRFTDRFAALFEDERQPPIAGRILALLLLSEGALSLDQLSEDLAVSKASASTNARLLAQLGLVEAVHQPGSRRDYYQVAADLFERSMAQRLARWRRFTEVIGEGRRTLPLPSREVDERLERYESAFSYMADAIGRAMVQWPGPPSRRLARVGSGR